MPLLVSFIIVGLNLKLNHYLSFILQIRSIYFLDGGNANRRYVFIGTLHCYSPGASRDLFKLM